jgi:hypothetical protein
MNFTRLLPLSHGAEALTVRTVRVLAVVRVGDHLVFAPAFVLGRARALAGRALDVELMRPSILHPTDELIGFIVAKRQNADESPMLLVRSGEHPHATVRTRVVRLTIRAHADHFLSSSAVS